jgi:transposase
MIEKVEQHICIKFCQKLGHSCSETYDMIQEAFGNEAMGLTQVKEWFRRFKEGQISAKSDERSGRLSMSRNQVMIDKLHSAVLDNQRITIRELSDELGLSFGLVLSILTEDLGMKRVSVKFVPKLLTVEQKETYLAVARDLVQCADQGHKPLEDNNYW